MEKRTLVYAPNWLGDAVMCMPFLKRLIGFQAEGLVDVLCPESLGELFRDFPGFSCLNFVTDSRMLEILYVEV